MTLTRDVGVGESVRQAATRHLLSFDSLRYEMPRAASCVACLGSVVPELASNCGDD
jgi:hypothetical protein